MRKATLTRLETGDEGTFGRFASDSGFTCFTGELPWRNNQVQHSCIPTGTYRCLWRRSPKFGECYLLEGVPGRSNILIHSANFMGDATKGFRSELLGCIAPGTKIDFLDGQRAVLASKAALEALQDDMARAAFELTIIGMR